MRLLLRSLRSLNTRSTLSAPTLAPSSLLSLPSSSLASSSSSSARAFSTSPSRALIGTGSIRRPRQKKHVRVGRGQGQGTGEGKGRGTKGQNARAGPGPHRAFSGGETPVTQQFPKRGFFNFSRKYYQPLSLRTLQEYIDLKRIDASEPITVEHIDKSNMVRGWKSANGFKLLARGFENLKQPIHIFPHRASSAAIKAIEAAGGSVTCVYHNRISFRQAIMPERFLGHRRVRDAFPMKKRDILYYTNWEKRGYLARKPDGWDTTPKPTTIDLSGHVRAPKRHEKKHMRIAKANRPEPPKIKRQPLTAIE